MKLSGIFMMKSSLHYGLNGVQVNIYLGSRQNSCRTTSWSVALHWHPWTHSRCHSGTAPLEDAAAMIRPIITREDTNSLCKSGIMWPGAGKEIFCRHLLWRHCYWELKHTDPEQSFHELRDFFASTSCCSPKCSPGYVLWCTGDPPPRNSI